MAAVHMADSQKPGAVLMGAAGRSSHAGCLLAWTSVAVAVCVLAALQLWHDRQHTHAVSQLLLLQQRVHVLELHCRLHEQVNLGLSLSAAVRPAEHAADVFLAGDEQDVQPSPTTMTAGDDPVTARAVKSSLNNLHNQSRPSPQQPAHSAGHESDEESSGSIDQLSWRNTVSVGDVTHQLYHSPSHASTTQQTEVPAHSSISPVQSVGWRSVVRERRVKSPHRLPRKHHVLTRLLRLENAVAGVLHVTAAHFEAHTSKRLHGHLDYYHGNYHMKNVHPDSRFNNWRPAAWMSDKNDFALTDSAVVTVKHAGLYYFYAQINHHGRISSRGFEVRVNSKQRLACVNSVETSSSDKLSTCHTSAILALLAGDRISIHDLVPHFVSILTPERSFFGLSKISTL